MKNMKKLISGIVAMMTVATAVSAAPAKLPVDILDVADATGVAAYTSEQARNKPVTPADKGGTWYLTNANYTNSAGSVIGDADSITISHEPSSRDREVSAIYTTDALYTSVDNKIQFSYKVDTVREKNSQLIQVSSGSGIAPQPSFAGVADCGGMSGDKFEYQNDGAIIKISVNGIEYLDPTTGELKKTDVELKADTEYIFRINNTVGEGTYDLYIDEVKIGANSIPVAEDIPLLNPTGAALDTVGVWLESAGIGQDDTTEFDEPQLNKFAAVISDIRFMQTLSDTQAMLAFHKEDFPQKPTSADGWGEYISKKNGKGIGEVTAGDNLAIKINNTTVSTTTGVHAEYTNYELASLDSYEISFNFVPTRNTNNIAECIELTDSATVAATGVAALVGNIGPKNNSVQIIMKDGKFYYGAAEEGVNSYKELPVSCTDGTRYYAKLSVNNPERTYSLYLSDSPILIGAEPVIKDAKFFCDDGTQIPKKILFGVYRASYGAHVGEMKVDNLTLSKSNNIIKTEGFGSLPTNGWYHKNSDSDLGTVTASGNLVIDYNTSKFKSTAMYSKYTASELAGEECFEVSYDFIPTLDEGQLWAAFTLIGNASTPIQNAPTGTGADIQMYSDSIQLAVINDRFMYGVTTASGSFFEDISDFVEFKNGTKYYLKIKVDAKAGTYTMWLSDEEITPETEAVTEDESFFLPSGTAPADWAIDYRVKRLEACGATGRLVVDNLQIVRNTKIPTDFAVLNDDQQPMTALGESAYIDLINVPADKEVIVAYYDAEGNLVDVTVATADSLRAKKTDDTAVSALVMTWDDFKNFVPSNAAIELK